jgi:hypothetical protein
MRTSNLKVSIIRPNRQTSVGSAVSGVVAGASIRQQTPCRVHLGAIGAQPPLSLVVVDKELETVTLVKRAFVSDGIH